MEANEIMIIKTPPAKRKRESTLFQVLSLVRTLFSNPYSGSSTFSSLTNGRTTYFSNYERRTKMEANEIMTNEEVMETTTEEIVKASASQVT